MLASHPHPADALRVRVDHDAEERERAQVVRQFARQVANQIYTDPRGSRRLLLQLDELSGTGDDATLRARVRLMQGNLANQDLDFEGAETFLRVAIDLAAEAGDHALRLEAMTDLAGTLLNADRVREVAELLDAAQELSTELASPLAWRVSMRRGFVELRLGSLDRAHGYLAEARALLPEMTPASVDAKEAYYAALLYAGFGRVYTRGREIERAIDAYASVVQLCGSFGMRGRLAYHHLDLGRALMAAGRRGDAAESFASAIREAGERDKLAVAAASANLGYYAYVDEDWDLATRYFDEAEHHYRTSSRGATGDLSVIAQWRSRLARARGEAEAAEEALLAAFELAREADDAEQLAEVCREIADFQAERGAYEAAYEYRLRYEDLRRAVDERASEQRVGELELRHELEKRRGESEMLKLRATRLQLKALRAQMNPHFIFNALNSIQEFIVSQRSTEAAAHLAHFARLMRQSLDYSEREQITLEDEIDFLTNYLELNRALRFAEPFAFEVHVGEDVETDLLTLPAMLVQPYVENALEHGIRLRPGGCVRIAFAHPAGDDERLLITVEDDGIGRAAAARQPRRRRSEHRSMGTSITERRLALLNREGERAAEVQFEDLWRPNGEPAGTRVRIELPVRWRG